MNKQDIQSEISQIETDMNQPTFWNDKDLAQSKIKRLQELKDELEGVGKYDKGAAVMTIYAGAGGDDSEDFVRMLLEMYHAYVNDRGWQVGILHEHKTDHGGYRNITIEIDGKSVYGSLKHESGVHRLVRISPFNANQKRHTSFAMVEVIPKFDRRSDFEIPEDEIKVDFAKSGGPGGQNVNKRETAVRMVHEPTGVSVHVTTERTQEANRDKALALLSAKLFKLIEDERVKKEEGMYISKKVDNEWGNQIRSYVLHPYKMVKDHRTDTEVRDVDAVLERGDIQKFIDAMQAK